MSVREAVEDVFLALSAQEPIYKVKATVGFLSGSTWREPGETVELGEQAARAAIKSGAAVASILSPSTAFFEGPTQEKPAAPAAPFADGPKVKIISGFFYQDGRTYGPGETVHFRGDLVRQLAIQQPEPGNATAAYAWEYCVRKMAVLEPINPLGQRDRERLARLRRNLEEPTDEVIAAARKLVQMAAV